MKLMGIAYCATMAGMALGFNGIGFFEATSAETHYFRVCPGLKMAACRSANYFVIVLQDPSQIQMAEDILIGKIVDKVHVQGKIVAQSAPYNPRWKFHLD